MHVRYIHAHVITACTLLLPDDSRLTELLLGDWGLSKQLRLQGPTKMQVCKLNYSVCTSHCQGSLSLVCA